ncbi:MAG: hypothetical protein QOC70_1579 [Verrucomicrobiota bacterium]
MALLGLIVVVGIFSDDKIIDSGNKQKGLLGYGFDGPVRQAQGKLQPPLQGETRSVRIVTSLNYGRFGFDWRTMLATQYEDITSENFLLFCHRHFAADPFGSS